MTKICSIDDCDTAVKAKGLCKRHYDRKWREDNPERTRELNRESARKRHAANPERNRENVRQWYAANKAAKRAYQIANREKYRHADQKYRAKKRSLTVEDIDYNYVWDRQNGICYLCNREMDRTVSYHLEDSDGYKRINPDFTSIEHLIPVSKGGPHIHENLAYAHLTCNMNKRTSLVFVMWEV